MKIYRNAKAASEAYAKSYVPPVAVGRKEMWNVVEKLIFISIDARNMGVYYEWTDDDRVALNAVRALVQSAPSAELMEAYRDELRNIAEAKNSNFVDAEEFRAWAQSRARFTLAAVEKAEKEGK